MTDKEQIIINGVNVSECENFKPKNRFSCHPYICNCHEKPNCYFKQLTRKTQECEDLREALKEEIIYKRTYLKALLDCKEECEELKEQLQANQPTGICDTCTATAVLQNDKYNKALDEIEDIVSGDYETLDPLAKKQIFNIINKAEGEGNE